MAGEQAVNASTITTTSDSVQACAAKLDHAIAGRRLAYVPGTYELTPDSKAIARRRL